MAQKKRNPSARDRMGDVKGVVERGIDRSEHLSDASKAALMHKLKSGFPGADQKMIRQGIELAFHEVCSEVIGRAIDEAAPARMPKPGKELSHAQSVKFHRRVSDLLNRMEPEQQAMVLHMAFMRLPLEQKQQVFTWVEDTLHSAEEEAELA